MSPLSPQFLTFLVGSGPFLIMEQRFLCERVGKGFPKAHPVCLCSPKPLRRRTVTASGESISALLFFVLPQENIALIARAGADYCGMRGDPFPFRPFSLSSLFFFFLSILRFRDLFPPLHRSGGQRSIDLFPAFLTSLSPSRFFFPPPLRSRLPKALVFLPGIHHVPFL